MNARERILARIRARQGRAGATTDADWLAARAVIQAHARGPQPGFAQHEPVQHFIEQCARLKTSVAEVATMQDVPREICRYLTEEALSMRLCGWSAFSGLDWASAGLAFVARPADRFDEVGLTGCFCAIGETGTLVLLGGPETPKVTALLPETHICVVTRSRIVATMEDAFGRLRDEVGEPPRSTFLVSGPSRTADIEQTIVIGAHGPYRVHVVLVADSSFCINKEN